MGTADGSWSWKTDRPGQRKVGNHRAPGRSLARRSGSSVAWSAMRHGCGSRTATATAWSFRQTRPAGVHAAELRGGLMNPRAFVQTMIALASASLGLVAALAWNEAIKATLAILGLGDSLAGLYAYAILATVLAVAVLMWLGRAPARGGRRRRLNPRARSSTSPSPTTPLSSVL